MDRYEEKLLCGENGAKYNAIASVVGEIIKASTKSFGYVQFEKDGNIIIHNEQNRKIPLKELVESVAESFSDIK